VPLRVALPDVVRGAGAPLERWRPGDEGALSALVAASVAHLKPFMAFAWAEPIDLAARRALLVSWDDEWRRGTLAHYRLTDDEGAPCGVISLTRSTAPQDLSIGYWLAPWEVGRGRVTPAAALLTAVALTHAEVDVVVITHDAANERSAAVPRRLGFARRRAETHDAWAGGGPFVTVRWEAGRSWRAPGPTVRYSAAKTPTGQDTPVPPSPQ
jgi:RimJ/RimL family protein N-acetyltransferase